MNKSLFALLVIITISISSAAVAETAPAPTVNRAVDATLAGAANATQYVTGSTILDTLIPSRKNCDYVNKKEYQPFSGIDSTFPGASTLGMTEGRKGETCISVTGGTENLVKLLFTTAISIIIILTVISISVAGIQYMTEQATGQIKGGAKKRLKDSLIALALALLSYTILYTVNRQLVSFDFAPGSIDQTGAIDRGIADANLAASSSGAVTALVDAARPVVTNGYGAATPSPTGFVNRLTGAPCVPFVGPAAPGAPADPCVPSPVSTPSWGEVTTPGNFSTYASFGSIQCSGSFCSSSKPTVFGYLDGDGTVGSTGDNGIGNASWSTKPGCTADTGNTITMGVALPQGFWRAAGILVADVKYIGIKVLINGVAQRILPVVDDSQQNLDFTFAAAKAYLDPTIVDSNRINTAGKNVTFEIIRDYYKTNAKTDIVYTSNRSTFINKIPCTI